MTERKKPFPVAGVLSDVNIVQLQCGGMHTVALSDQGKVGSCHHSQTKHLASVNSHVGGACLLLLRVGEIIVTNMSSFSFLLHFIFIDGAYQRYRTVPNFHGTIIS